MEKLTKDERLLLRQLLEKSSVTGIDTMKVAVSAYNKINQSLESEDIREE